MSEMNESSYTLPPFSVLMAVYARDEPIYFKEALSSIKHQTVPPFEVILVQDGPVSKKIENVIKEFKSSFDGKFCLVKLPKNQGLGKALDIGSSYISTEWIARADSDDINAPDRFEKQLNEIKRDPNLSLIGGQIAEYDESQKNKLGYRIVPNTEQKIKKYLKWRSPFNHPTVMIKKDALAKAGGYLSFGNFEDYYLWARLIANGEEVKNISDVLVHMRVNDDLYRRRGNLSNIKYVIYLQKYFYIHNLANLPQSILGAIIKLLNLFISGKMRKYLYRSLIHQKNYRGKE